MTTISFNLGSILFAAVACLSVAFYIGHFLGREQEKDRARNEAKRVERSIRRGNGRPS